MKKKIIITSIFASILLSMNSYAADLDVAIFQYSAISEEQILKNEMSESFYNSMILIKNTYI